jgi:hypothetical protein
MTPSPRSIGWLLLLLACPGLAGAFPLGNLDDFEDGTTENWVVALLGVPHPAPPVNIANGGPDGDGDNYLRLTSVGGAAAGSRLVIINAAQWAGDYTIPDDSPIQRYVIQGWVNNFINNDLFLRVLLENPMGGGSTDIAISEAVMVPAGGGWVPFEIPLGPDDLTVLEGSLDALLPNVTAVRLLHSQGGAFPGEPLVLEIGFDDLLATGIVIDVPESAALGLMLAALAGLVAPGALRRKRWR